MKVIAERERESTERESQHKEETTYIFYIDQSGGLFAYGKASSESRIVLYFHSAVRYVHF
jgi:hypothetical protein